MKTKKFHKKLSLNKKTIASLNNVNMMGNVHGGVETPQVEPGDTQTYSCCLGYTDCPDCTQQTCVTCNTCYNTCFSNCSECLTFCGPRGAIC